MLFQDEARFGCSNDRRRCWAPPPCRPHVHQQIVRQFVYGLVAVSPRDGQLASLVLPWVDTETMSLFPAHTAACFPDQHCLLLLDGAGWHRASDLRVPPTLHLLFLPAYSPELNPVEQIWKHLREHFFRNEAFDSLDSVVDRLCEGLYYLHQNPTLVQPMACYDWLKTLPVM